MEGSASFLKKRSKKRLFSCGLGDDRGLVLQLIKVFLLLFVHKKKGFPASQNSLQGIRHD
jgi:hypothetical protein